MTKEMFWVDTSFLYALFVRADMNHGKANELWRTCIQGRSTLVTSNVVLSELGTLLVYRFNHRVAFERLCMLHDSSLLHRLHSTEEIESSALQWLSRFADQKFSYVDCVSFECMRRLGIRRALTFDSDFSIAGYSRA